MVNLKNFWEKFYYKNYELKHISKNSPFSKFVLSRIENYTNVIDLGCGNARDSIFFYSKGKNVLGLDSSLQAINLNIIKSKTKKINFIKFDVTQNLSKVVNLKSPKCFYSRFLIHSLKPNMIKMHFKQLGKIFSKNDIMFIEYRSYEDKFRKKIFNNHYRNFMKTDQIESFLNKNYLYSALTIKGAGFAKFKSENPFIARHIIKRYK